MREYKIKESAKEKLQGLFLACFAYVIHSDALGAAVFLWMLSAILLLHDSWKIIYRICLRYVRYCRRKLYDY